MSYGQDTEYVANNGRGSLVTNDDKQPSLFGTVLSNIKDSFTITSGDKTIESINIIGDTLRYKVFHLNEELNKKKYQNTIEEAFDDTERTERQYYFANEKYKESMKRLINITKYTIFNSNIYIKYIKDVYVDVYFREEDFTIKEDPQQSLYNLIKTLRDIVDDNTYREYIINKYKLVDYSILYVKEQIYEKLIEHLEKIKSSKLTIDERYKKLGRFGGNNKQYKEILGKRRRIYKIKGSRKDHVKYKGELIPVSDYKKLVKK
jgi:hypothetical protein